MLHLRVHDSSRLEWIAELPIPGGNASRDFQLELELEVPEHIWTRHDHWERLQFMARLSSPNEEKAPESGFLLRTVDDLRRSALAAARQAKRHQSYLESLIFSASSLLSASARPSLGDELDSRLRSALSALRSAKRLLGEPRPSDATELARERPLAEEFLSNHVIELIFRVEKAIATHLLGPRLRHPEYRDDAERIRSLLASAMAEELKWRQSRGLSSPSEENPWELERHVGRVNLVRRHFQGLLYLHVQTELMDTRFRPLFAAVAATLGALLVFPLALFLTGGFGVGGLSVGLTGSALLVALTYGVRERIKDAARAWLANRLTENVGGRTAVLTTMPRLKEEAVRVLRGRESFSLNLGRASDPMHPDLGDSMAVERFRYRMKGTVHPVPGVAQLGSERVKLVFRYDLSPLFSRLDDPFKEVPVLAADGASLRFVEAARCYRIPLRLTLRHRGETWTEKGTLVAHKLGLERIEPAPTAAQPLVHPAGVARESGSISSMPTAMMRRR